MEVEGSVVLITGANGGLGRAMIAAFAEASAARVYAAARTSSGAADLARDFPAADVLVCDVTNPAEVDRLRASCSDANVLVNNAGVNHRVPALGSDDGSLAADEIAVNYLGTLKVCRAMSPQLIANRPATVVNVLSVLSRVSHPGMASYSASKAAAGSLTQALRAQLTPQGVNVIAFMPSSVDTRMSEGLEIPKTAPVTAAQALLSAIENEDTDVHPDAVAAQVAAGLAVDPKAVEQQFAAFAPPAP
jgi:NAD(P)-dependent dehydrogenase (short-subunit alcohol dehydrogenase family)